MNRAERDRICVYCGQPNLGTSAKCFFCGEHLPRYRPALALSQHRRVPSDRVDSVGSTLEGGIVDRSWNLTRMSLDVLERSPSMLEYPLVTIGVLVASLAVLGGLILFTDGGPLAWVLDWPRLLFSFGILYLVLVCTLTYTRGALVAATLLRTGAWSQEKPRGWRIAASRIWSFVAWSIIAGTLGLLLFPIGRVGFVGQSLGGVAGMGWGVATYFVVPAMLVEGWGPVQAIDRSARLASKVFGAAVVSNLFTDLLVAGGVITGAVLASYGAIGVIAGGPSTAVLVLLLLGSVIGAVSADLALALEGIIAANLYQYAAENPPGSVPVGATG